MKKKETSSTAKFLRQNAEDIIKKRLAKTKTPFSEDEILNLVHELEVHQIELEMQNEELVQAKEHAEIATQKYTELYDFAPSGYMTLSKEGTILELNLSIAKMIGKERSRLINNQFGFFVSDDTKAFFNLFFDKTFKNNTKQTCELSLLTIDNLQIPVYLTGILSENEQECLITIVDITERKRAENLLQETNSYLENLIDHANAPIIVWDPQFCITRFNHAFEFLTGLLENEVIGKSLELLFPPSKIESSMSLIRKTSTGERWESVEIEIIHKDLSKRTLLWNSATIMDQDGKNPIATIAQGQDITERKKVEKELRESEKFLKETQTIAILGAFSMEINTGKWKSSEVLDSIMGINENINKTIEDWSNIIHPEWRQIMLTYLTKEVIGKKLKFDKEYKIIRQNDQQERWVHGLGELIFDDQNEPVKMIGTVQDITERKKNEEKILQLSQAVEQSPVTIVITDTKGVINYVNPKFTETTGFSYEETIGKNPRMLKSGHTSPEEYKILWKTITEGKNWHGEFHNKKKDGSLYWESASISPIINSKGETTHYIAIKEDITERKLAEKKLIIANEELAFENKEKEKRALELFKAKERAEESDRLKSAFLANMSHEIRTPMNGILGFAELLKEPNLTGEDQKEYIKIIQESGTRMLNIINDIIDISKIESKQMKTALTATNINDKIKFVYNFFKPEVDKKGIQFLFKNGLPDNDSIINTDNEKIYAILTNLVKNAIKFTDKGSIELGYSLKKESNSPELEFYIKDTGVGIPKAKQLAIFDRFIQANLTDKRAFEGAGLGLSISKAYVELLGGKLWVESQEGKGSIFYFTIPYNTKQKDEILNNTSSLEKKEEKPVKDLKILIVEDDKISNLLITKAVKIFSKEVLKATTGFEAVEACRNNPDIDLVLMDVNMPVMNGYEATKQIRQFNKEVVIIAQTAYGLASDREDAITAGCTDYISKPIKIEILKELIQKYFKN